MQLPEPATPSRSCSVSEQPGNPLTLPVNRAANPTHAAPTSIMFRPARGVTRRQGPAIAGVSAEEERLEKEEQKKSRASRLGPGSQPGWFWRQHQRRATQNKYIRNEPPHVISRANRQTPQQHKLPSAAAARLPSSLAAAVTATCSMTSTNYSIQ